MKYLNTVNGDYPVSLDQLRKLFPNVSFALHNPPAPFVRVVETVVPAAPGKKAVELPPKHIGDGVYEQQWGLQEVSTVDKRRTFKEQRAIQMQHLTVTSTNGHVFDADETSQNRMVRAVLGLHPGESMPWVLADNTVAEISRGEFTEVLRLAGEAQASIWFMQEGSGQATE